MLATAVSGKGTGSHLGAEKRVVSSPAVMYKINTNFFVFLLVASASEQSSASNLAREDTNPTNLQGDNMFSLVFVKIEF